MGLCAFLGVDYWPQVGNRRALGIGFDVSSFQHCHSALNTVRPVPPALCVESHQSWTEVDFDRAAFSPKEDIEHLLLGACILRENHPTEHSLWDFPDAVTGEYVVPRFCSQCRTRSLHALQISSRASIITPPVELAELRGADLVAPSLPPHRETKWPQRGTSSGARACELIPPLTHQWLWSRRYLRQDRPDFSGAACYLLPKTCSRMPGWYEVN